MEEVWGNNSAFSENNNNFEKQCEKKNSNSEIANQNDFKFPQKIDETVLTPVKKSKEAKLITKIVRSETQNKNQDQPTRIFYNLRKNFTAKAQNKQKDKFLMRSETSIAEIHKINSTEEVKDKKNSKKETSIHNIKSWNSFSSKTLEKVEVRSFLEK